MARARQRLRDRRGQRRSPFELTPARIRAICAPHTGVFADGILLLSDPDEPGFVARLRIFNPDGSEAELSGNGAREAILYLRRRGWTDSGHLLDPDRGRRRSARRSPREPTCTVDMGRARLQSADYPTGADDGRGELTADGRTWRFQHVQVGNPQCAIAVDDEHELDALDLPAIGPRDRAPRAVPEPHERVVVRRARPGHDPRADLRARGGGDVRQRHRRHRRGGRLRARTAASSPVTVVARRRRARSRRGGGA